MNQPRILKTFNDFRKTFAALFFILILILIFLPLLTTFNDILTRIVINLKGYAFIREFIVPFEVRLVAVVLRFLGFEASVTKEYVVLGQNQPLFAEIIWNCIGWQSLLFFVITAFVGLQGDKYTNFSKAKALIVGLFGTFLINILRIVVVIISAYKLGPLTTTIIHEYASLLAVIGWLFFFWWFTYQFILEEKQAVVQEEAIRV